LDPETQKPKVKLYRHKANKEERRMLKGDTSICYAHLESVHLALQILDWMKIPVATERSFPSSVP
jgi:hypothetical protein